MNHSKRSGRGGFRKNAGRKSTWQNQETCTIRIPKIFAETLSELARRLDSGEIFEFATKSKSITYDPASKSNWMPELITTNDSIPRVGAIFDIGTQSIGTAYEYVPESKNFTFEYDAQIAAPNRFFDSGTRSNRAGNVTVSKSKNDLTEAIKQAKNIIKSKKSARESMARLLSRLYATTIHPEKLK